MGALFEPVLVDTVGEEEGFELFRVIGQQRNGYREGEKLYTLGVYVLYIRSFLNVNTLSANFPGCICEFNMPGELRGAPDFKVLLFSEVQWNISAVQI